MDDLLADLLESLERLLAQAQAYERALPGDNPTARSAVSTLSELARQARNQAQDLGEALAGPSKEHPLSPRQLEVLQLAAKGLTNKEIAYRLNLSERTVQYHLRSVFNKTGTNSRTEAAAHAIRQGWL